MAEREEGLSVNRNNELSLKQGENRPIETQIEIGGNETDERPSTIDAALARELTEMAVREIKETVEETDAVRLGGLLLWLSGPRDGDDLLNAVKDASRRTLSPAEAELVLKAIVAGLEDVLEEHADEILILEAENASGGDEE